MAKLDPKQIKYIIRKMEDGGDVKTIGCEMKVSERSTPTAQTVQGYGQNTDTRQAGAT